MDGNPLKRKRTGHGGDIYSDESREWLDLSANINPKEFPESLYEALPGILEEARAYPDIEYSKLRKDLASYAGKLGGISLDPAWIIPGNGAVEILDGGIAASKKALIIQPCFSEYELSCLRHGVSYEVLTREPSKDVRLEASLFDSLTDRIRESRNRREAIDLVIFCNPNNPDGKHFAPEAFEEFMRRFEDSGLKVMVDETFGEYLEDEEMLLPLVTKFEDLMVVKAMTKFFGLPGVRLGYGITGSKGWREAIQDRLTTWNVGTVAESIARILTQDEAFIKSSREENRETRAYLTRELEKTGLFDEVFPSAASFVMVHHRNMPSLIEALRSQGILIRDLSGMAGLGEGYERIAVKDRSHVDRLLEVLTIFKGKI